MNWDTYVGEATEVLRSYFALLSFGEDGWGYQLLSATAMTIMISVAGYSMGILAGVGGVAMKLSRHRPLRILGAGYTTGVRAIPELLLILLIYYSGTSALNNVLKSAGLDEFITISPFWAAAVTLGFVQGAYLTEVFRAARAAIPNGLLEASDALGLNSISRLRFITIPLAMRHALPGMSNIWVVTIKESSLISVVGLHEVMMVGKTAAAYEQKYFFFFFITALIYFSLCKSSSVLVEKMLKDKVPKSTVKQPSLIKAIASKRRPL